jgi:hypothetical protein
MWPQGTINGGMVHYPYVNKIAQHTEITPANIPKEEYKQYFARHYEIKEQSTAQTLSDLLEYLKTETDDEKGIHFSVKLLDEDE